MLSNFQVTESVWLPDRFTLLFAARVNTRAVLLQLAVSASQVAT